MDTPTLTKPKKQTDDDCIKCGHPIYEVTDRFDHVEDGKEYSFICDYLLCDFCHNKYCTSDQMNQIREKVKYLKEGVYGTQKKAAC